MITKEKLLKVLESVPDDAMIDIVQECPIHSRSVYIPDAHGAPIKGTAVHKDRFEINISIRYEQ